MPQVSQRPSNAPVRIPSRNALLNGVLDIPEGATGIVVFAYGNDGSRPSLHNLFVARELRRAGMATLLFDLLTEAEESLDMRTRRYRLDVALLGARVASTTRWLRSRPETRGLRIGYLAGGTGSAAALVAAAAMAGEVAAVVSGGGRPDLAADALPRVASPTLLIVGGLESETIELSREAYARLKCRKSLRIVPGASHLFEEPGTLERMAELACSWFGAHLESPAREAQAGAAH